MFPYRLSRDEYSHSVYDLLGVDYDARAPGALSPDPVWHRLASFGIVWHGFERIGSELSLAPSHVEKYLQAAVEIVDRAFPDKEPEKISTRRDAPEIDWHNRQKRKGLDEIGVAQQVMKTEHINNEGVRGYMTVQLLSGVDPGLIKEISQAKGIFLKSGELGRSCDAIRECYRKYGVGRHVIFYRTVDGWRRRGAHSPRANGCGSVSVANSFSANRTT